MIKKLFIFLLTVLFTLAMVPARAEPITTVLLVSKALQDSLQALQDSIVTAGGEMTGVGNSWQKNGQNVLVDINNMLGSKMNTAIENLNDSERKLISDAQNLTGLIKKSTNQVISHSFQEARITLGDADILAYNTSYSLPCRNQEPRIVYWTPTMATITGNEVLVTAKGNFLNIDTNVQVLVNGVITPIIAQTDRDLTFKVPTSVLATVQNQTTIGINVAGLHKRVRSSGLLSAVFGCSEKKQAVPTLRLALTLRPPIVYSIDASIVAESTAWSPTYEAYKTEPKFYRSTGAGGNVNVSEQYCLKANEVVVDAHLTITDRGGPSTAGPWVLSGERCVYVPARVQGNGFDSFRISKGGGNIGYVLSIIGKHPQVVSLNEQQYHYVTHAGENVVSFVYQNLPEAKDLKWKFKTNVKVLRGTQILFNDMLTEVTPVSPSGVSINFKDGTMSVTLPGEQPWTEL